MTYSPGTKVFSRPYVHVVATADTADAEHGECMHLHAPCNAYLLLNQDRRQELERLHGGKLEPERPFWALMGQLIEDWNMPEAN